MASTVDYNAYRASREWALKRNAALERSGGMCERCHLNRSSQVHHFTYARVGREELDDLAAVCAGCHEFLSGKTGEDPVSAFFHGLHADVQRPKTYSWLFTQCKSFTELQELWNYLACPEDCEGCGEVAGQ